MLDKKICSKNAFRSSVDSSTDLLASILSKLENSKFYLNFIETDPIIGNSNNPQKVRQAKQRAIKKKIKNIINTASQQSLSLSGLKRLGHYFWNAPLNNVCSPTICKQKIDFDTTNSLHNNNNSYFRIIRKSKNHRCIHGLRRTGT